MENGDTRSCDVTTAFVALQMHCALMQLANWLLPCEQPCQNQNHAATVHSQVSTMLCKSCVFQSYGFNSSDHDTSSCTAILLPLPCHYRCCCCAIASDSSSLTGLGGTVGAQRDRFSMSQHPPCLLAAASAAIFALSRAQ